VLTYLAGAVIAWTVTMALGEMASVHPAAGSFGVYAELYLNPWAGFVARYGYWFAVVISVAAELVASATYTAFWFPNVPPQLWIVAYAAVLLAINLRQVGDYGRFEYWFAMVKVATIVLFILVGAALLFGGRVEAQYTAAGGFLPHGALGPIKAISFALFSFLGVEMVAISSGEARGSREIARATRIMFTLLAFVYVGAIAILVGVMPWQAAGVRQSPFVTVFEVAGIPAASTLMNAVVLSAALSGANASLYVASRMLFSLARGGYAPTALDGSQCRILAHAVAVSATGILVAVAAEIRARGGVSLHHRRVAVRRRAGVVGGAGRARTLPIAPVERRGRAAADAIARRGARVATGIRRAGARHRLNVVGGPVAHHHRQRRTVPARAHRRLPRCSACRASKNRVLNRFVAAHRSDGVADRRARRDDARPKRQAGCL
jgi:hypothetical protein